MFYDSYGTSKTKKLSPVSVREHVKSEKCKREMVINYFGYSLLILK